MLTFNDTDRKTMKERRRSRVCINYKEHASVMKFRRHIITFLGIKEQAHSLGVPDFALKIFRLQINNGKGENYLIQTQAQWDLERASLIGSCGELNGELLQNAGHFGPGLFCPGLFHPNLGGWSFLLKT